MARATKNEKLQGFRSVDEIFETFVPDGDSAGEQQSSAKQQSLGVRVAAKLLRDFEKGVVKSQRPARATQQTHK